VGALDAIRWLARASRRADGLWEHTCFEAFVAVGGRRRTSSSTSRRRASAVYRFARHRERAGADPAVVPRVGVSRGSDAVDVEATLPFDARRPAWGSRRSWSGRTGGSQLGAPPSRGGAGLPRRPWLRARRRMTGRVRAWGRAAGTATPDVREPGPWGLGIDRLLEDATLRRPLADGASAWSHPASVTGGLVHSLDALVACGDVRVTAAFGPQHGLRGDKQDNMIESPDFTDPVHGIPVFSLYGEVRRPTPAMLDACDVLMVDLQDVGTRIYTFITTLRYVLEAAAAHGKAVWVLDRPNPIGRPVEGLRLRPGQESFVGAAPLPMRHGLTMGELARWFVTALRLDVEHEVVTMEGWRPSDAPGWGWPLGERSWVNPSPNIPEPRGRRPLSGDRPAGRDDRLRRARDDAPARGAGCADVDPRALLATMTALAPEWLRGCRLRPCWFEPTFHKHVESSARGFQVHVDDPAYDHEAFGRGGSCRRVQGAPKPGRTIRSGEFEYEYERDRLAIDVLNGGPLLREWVDDPAATVGDPALAAADERTWVGEMRSVEVY
jgi:uncharacterized protein YbbC (DUF1343 family)